MFCNESKQGKNNTMSCGEVWLQEIVTFISLICTLFVLTISFINLKRSLFDKLIIHILISEMIDQINILLSIISDSFGGLNFENSHPKMLVCFSQIFVAIFSCLWTLTASFFISLKLYDVIIKKNKLFKEGSFLNKNTILLSISIPLLISYIIWMIQTIEQAEEFSMEGQYNKNTSNKVRKRFKMGFCWVNNYLSVIICIIATVLICGNFYFSIFKGYFFLKNAKKEYKNNNLIRTSNISQIQSLNKVQNNLFLYPTVASILWALFFIFKLFFELKDEYKTKSVFSWIFNIFISTRQIIYISVYFFTQQKLKIYAYQVLTFKVCKMKKKPNLVELKKQIGSSEPILQIEEENDKNIN